jgi:hypothetical protein
MKKLILLLLHCQLLMSQSSNFDIQLRPLQIPTLGGIQSYAYAQNNGYILIIGGRLDGLHRRQPFAAFDQAGHNTQIVVIHPTTYQKWSVSMNSLPVSMQEQLSSTNMQFHQEGNYLYILGGYGFSATQNNHTTFPYLTAIQVPDLIQAIISNQNINPFFRQITDTQFQVTGGRLRKIYNNYYLAGGHKFLGRYNPMGPNNGPGFIQEYTNAVKRFNIVDDGTNIQIQHIRTYIDTIQLHRRDFNVESNIKANGEESIILYSGVFQPNANLPFLNAIELDSTSHQAVSGFNQYYNHYHCPVIPIYHANQNEMHHLFFGGISQYYDSLGILVQDNNVPFVSTIARVSRDASGNYAEYKLPNQMPSLLGAGAEFIPNKSLTTYTHDIILYDSLNRQDTTLLGYIYGGISSTAANIFFLNDGTQSTAHNGFFEVLLIPRNQLSTEDELNTYSAANLEFIVYPNPNKGIFTIEYNQQSDEPLELKLFSTDGKLIFSDILPKSGFQKNKTEIDIRDKVDIISSNTFYIQLINKENQWTQKIVLKS